LQPDWRLVGAFAYLWCDIAVLWACLRATGHAPPIGVIVLAYQIGYLANVVPIPGNVGVLEGSFVGMFVLYGVKATPAAAASVVYHAIALWIPLLWGTIAFIRLQAERHEPLGRRRRRGSGGS
ncbi:MAG TPA: lysylphosphatidylglycerol synthase transmembrane domain-containing protein, partial [Solirubrobacteraceae bacterium]|nr:lysylphosphatidylglycerol synthase transmembrane domain-containing protein [Solirubrobacteraceae bacterium]